MTSITVQYQKKVKSSRNITPGWIRELDYAREISLFWKRMWIQCDKPTSGVVSRFKMHKKKYRHPLGSLKSKRNTYINSPYANVYLETTTMCTGMSFLNKEINYPVAIYCDCDDNTYIVSYLKQPTMMYIIV